MTEPTRATLVWDPDSQSWRRSDEPKLVQAPAPERRPSALRAGVIGGVVGALLSALVTIGVVRTLDTVAPAAVERVLSPGSAAPSGEGTIVEIAARARPSVVNVEVTGRQPGILGAFRGTGSGVILRSDGYVVTNAHVVEGASEVFITLSAGERVTAQVVATDPDTDIAVLKSDRSGLAPAVIGRARDLKVGELVVAIGSPLGLQQSVTAGIVSALGRTVDRQGEQPLVDMIQTDAAVTQGNSGGALLDGRGALVGINSAIAASRQVGAEGVAFAIPIEIAKAVFDELIATGRATHPWMGVSGATLDALSAEQFGVERGALVAAVVPGAPADRAGLRARDVVVSVDGSAVEGMDDLVIAIRQHKVGDRLKVEYVRDRARQTADVTLGDRPRS